MASYYDGLAGSLQLTAPIQLNPFQNIGTSAIWSMFDLPTTAELMEKVAPGLSSAALSAADLGFSRADLGLSAANLGYPAADLGVSPADLGLPPGDVASFTGLNVATVMSQIGADLLDRSGWLPRVEDALATMKLRGYDSLASIQDPAAISGWMSWSGAEVDLGVVSRLAHTPWYEVLDGIYGPPSDTEPESARIDWSLLRGPEALVVYLTGLMSLAVVLKHKGHGGVAADLADWIDFLLGPAMVWLLIWKLREERTGSKLDR